MSGEQVTIEYPANQSLPIQFGCAMNNMSKYFIDRGLSINQIVACMEFLKRIYEDDKAT